MTVRVPQALEYLVRAEHVADRLSAVLDQIERLCAKPTRTFAILGLLCLASTALFGRCVIQPNVMPCASGSSRE
jgi:hypothetical protein